MLVHRKFLTRVRKQHLWRRRRRRRRRCARTRPSASARVHLKIAAAGVSDRSVAAPRAQFQNVYFQMVVAGLRREIVNVRFIFKSSRRRAAADPAPPARGWSSPSADIRTDGHLKRGRRPLKTRSTAGKGLATADSTEPNAHTGAVRVVQLRSSIKLALRVKGANRRKTLRAMVQQKCHREKICSPIAQTLRICTRPLSLVSRDSCTYIADKIESDFA